MNCHTGLISASCFSSFCYCTSEQGSQHEVKKLVNSVSSSSSSIAKYGIVLLNQGAIMNSAVLLELLVNASLLCLSVGVQKTLLLCCKTDANLSAMCREALLISSRFRIPFLAVKAAPRLSVQSGPEASCVSGLPSRNCFNP